jgi:hypothetical protein
VETTAIVKRSVLKNKTTKVAMSCNDVVGLFFLTKLVAIVLTYLLSSLTDKAGEVTRLPCIAENREPPKTPATPSIWNGCIRMLCSAWKTNI